MSLPKTKAIVRSLAKKGKFEQILQLNASLDDLNQVDGHGKNILHLAAEGGKLHQVPEIFYTKDRVLATTDTDENLLHIAATFGELGSIPRKFLTLEGLSQFDMGGNTPYHYAANHGSLESLPDKSLSQEALLIKCSWGTTVYEQALWKLLGSNSQNHRFLDKLTIKIQTPNLINLYKNGKELNPAIKKYLRRNINRRSMELLSIRASESLEMTI